MVRLVILPSKIAFQKAMTSRERKQPCPAARPHPSTWAAQTGVHKRAYEASSPSWP
jgi:hypothetical protein